jgi:hypothetical protein
MLCTWQIHEIDEQEIEGQVAHRLHSAKNVPANTTEPPPRAGRFRILTADSKDRLRSGQHRLMHARNSNVATGANALFMAEFGLYHEALLFIEADLKSQIRHNSVLLARTVQTLIYKQMLRQIEQDQIEQEQKMHSVSIPPLTWYNTWTVNRERYHRELSIALMKGQCPRRCLKEVSSRS